MHTRTHMCTHEHTRTHKHTHCQCAHSLMVFLFTVETSTTDPNTTVDMNVEAPMRALHTESKQEHQQRLNDLQYNCLQPMVPKFNNHQIVYTLSSYIYTIHTPHCIPYTHHTAYHTHTTLLEQLNSGTPIAQSTAYRDDRDQPTDTLSLHHTVTVCNTVSHYVTYCNTSPDGCIRC